MTEREPNGKSHEPKIDKEYFGQQLKQLLEIEASEFKKEVIEAESILKFLKQQEKKMNETGPNADDSKIEEIISDIEKTSNRLKFLLGRGELDILVKAIKKINLDEYLSEEMREKIDRALKSLDECFRRFESLPDASFHEQEALFGQTPQEYLTNILGLYEQSVLVLVGTLDEILPEKLIHKIAEEREIFIRHIQHLIENSKN